MTRPQFVLFGSSVVQLSYGNGGWGATLADIYSRKADILLRGYNGWNTRHALQVLGQVFPKDALVQPSLVVVFFGGNDSSKPDPSGEGPHVPLEEYKSNMKCIATHLKSLSETIHIIFLSCPPYSEEKFLEKNPGMEPTRSNEICKKYSDACIKVGQEMGVEVVDLSTAIQKRDRWEKVCFVDGSHFSPEGSKIVAEEVLKVIKDAKWKPSLYWKSLPSEFHSISNGIPSWIPDGHRKLETD